MILLMPHPFTFSEAAPPATSQQQPGKKAPSPFSMSNVRTRLFYRPLESLSDSIAPASRVYRGLTPQFKVFLQIAAMTLGGCIWAEHRVTEYLEATRKVKRVERVQAERAQMSRPYSE